MDDRPPINTHIYDAGLLPKLLVNNLDNIGLLPLHDVPTHRMEFLGEASVQSG